MLRGLGVLLLALGAMASMCWGDELGKPEVVRLTQTDYLYHGGVETVDVAISADGRRYAAINKERMLTVWDARTGKQQMQIRLPWKGIKVFFEGEGSEIVVAGWRGLFGYDLNAGKEITRWKDVELGEKVSSITKVPDGRSLLVTSGGQRGGNEFDQLFAALFGDELAAGPEVDTQHTSGTTAVWDLERGVEMGRVPRTFRSTWLSADRKTLVGQPAIEVDDIEDEDNVRGAVLEIWDVEKGLLVKRMDLVGPAKKGCDVVLSPDGDTVYLFERTLNSRKIFVFDRPSEECLFTIKTKSAMVRLACFPDGKRAFVHFLGIADAQIVSLEEGGDSVSFPLYSVESQLPVAVSGDGSRMLLGEVGACVRVIETVQGAPVWPGLYVAEQPRPRFTPDGKNMLMLVVKDGAFQFGSFSADTGNAQTVPLYRDNFIPQIFGDGGVVYLGKPGRRAKWRALDMANGDWETAEPPKELGLPPVVKKIVVEGSGSEQVMVQIQDARSEEVLYQHPEPCSVSHTWKLSPDGAVLVQTIPDYDPNTGEDAEGARRLYRIGEPTKFIGELKRNLPMKFAADGSVFMQRSDDTLFFVDPRSGDDLYSLPRVVDASLIPAELVERDKYIGYCDRGRVLMSVHRQVRPAVEGKKKVVTVPPQQFLRFRDALSGVLLANYRLPDQAIGTIAGNPAWPSGVIIYKNGEAEQWRLPRRSVEPVAKMDVETVWKWLQVGEPDQVREALLYLSQDEGVALSLSAREVAALRANLMRQRAAIEKLLPQFDSDRFSDRTEAARQILDMSIPRKAEILRAMGKQPSLSLEQRSNLERVLQVMDREPAALAEQSLGRLQWVLRRIGSPEAIEQLATWESAIDGIFSDLPARGE